MPAQGSPARVRFIDGAPSLQTIIGSIPQSICSGASAPCYLQINGVTATQNVYYGSITTFVGEPSGTLSIVARDERGYAVGPLKTPALSPGGRYTLVIVGSYPNYSVLAFEEPKPSDGAQLSLYEASPTVRQTGFGSFDASSSTHFKQLGTAKFGSVATVSLGKSVSNFGGYAGPPKTRLGAFTLAQIDPFDSHNVLPFHAASRLSLFLFDKKSNGNGPLFGSLDR